MKDTWGGRERAGQKWFSLRMFVFEAVLFGAVDIGATTAAGAMWPDFVGTPTYNLLFDIGIAVPTLVILCATLGKIYYMWARSNNPRNFGNGGH